MDRPPLIDKLMPDECRRLIAAGGIGRIAFGTASGPVVFPVNFAVVAGTIVIRTGEGTMIAGHADEQVAFEVDHIDEALCQGWSVLVRGQTHRVAHPAELEHVRHDAAIWPWPGDDRDVYVRIVPDKISAAGSRAADPRVTTSGAAPRGGPASYRFTAARRRERPGRPAGRCNPTRCRTSRTP
jgi:hypothetical protein